MRLPIVALTAVALVACGKAGVEPRPSPPKSEALLAKAQKGDYAAQRTVAGCFESTSNCPDASLQPDPSQACAWRAAILASRSPSVELADADRYEASCNQISDVARQEAYNAAADLIRTVYGQRVVMPLPGVASSTNPHTLYPSAETVRVRINNELRAAGDTRQLPPFGTPEEDKGNYAGFLIFRSCDRDLCLSAAAPPFGGGIEAMKVALNSGGPAQQRIELVVRLATAAVNFRSAAPDVVQVANKEPDDALRYINFGAVCWGAGVDTKGHAMVGALRGRCADHGIR